MKIFVSLSIIVYCLIDDTRPQALPELSTNEWNLFKSRYSKTYKSSTEETLRMQTYINNKKFIASHNEKFHKGEVSFELGMNQFGDMLHSEFLQKLNNNKFTLTKNGKNKKQMIRSVRTQNVTLLSLLPSNTTSDSLDWRKKGVVSPVKNEKECHASWAFSANGAIESTYAVLTGKLIPLSEQNLIDCIGQEISCERGIISNAFDYALYRGDINIEKSYPYEGVQNQCRYNPENSAGYSLTGYVEGEAFHYIEDILKGLVISSPLSIFIDASHQSFQFYKTGVYYEPECRPDEPTRWALAVGYGSENGTDYWLLKNSWGTSWGEEGYIRLARNKDTHCGIGKKYSYPFEFGIHQELYNF